MMFKHRMYVIALAILAVGLTACGPSVRSASCSGSGGSNGGLREMRCQVTLAKSGASGPISFAGFDASLASLDLSESNVNAALNVALTVNVVLRNNGAIVASNAFAATQSGYVVTFDNPTAVNAWLAGYNGLATTIEGDIDGVGFVEKPGTNVASFRFVYGGAVDSGVTDSWYTAPGGSGCGVNCQQN